MDVKRIVIFVTLFQALLFEPSHANDLNLINSEIITKKLSGKKITGIVLTANGIVGLSFGIPFLIHGSQKGNDLSGGFEYAMSFVLGLIGVVEGTATLIPGCILLTNFYSNDENANKLITINETETVNRNSQIFLITIKF